jgi:hypothetical protein
MKVKLLIALLVTVVGCAGQESVTGPSDPGFPSYVKLQSDAGDYIGQGKSYEYTTADAILDVQSSGVDLTIGIQGDEYWSGEFHIPSSVGQIAAGTYDNVTRFPGSATQPTMSWEGEGRGCSSLTATVTIDAVSYANGGVSSLDMHFTQHCDGVSAALHGTVHWKAGDPTKVAGPVNPIPTNLWRPTISLPSTGNYVYIASEAGDYVGGGGTYLYTSPNSTIGVSANGAHVSVVVNSYDWNGDFQGMISLELLQTGYYATLERYPFNNPARGGLDWSGMGRGCNKLTGWFVVDAVTYSGVTLTSIDLRFEQHCDGAAAALHGAIHWHA